MPPGCCVPLCVYRGGHSFPRRDVARMKQWIFAIKRAMPTAPGKVWMPSKYAVVCKDHFDIADYKPQTYYGKSHCNL